MLVPYAVDGETEQTDRAERLARIGRVGVIAEAELSDIAPGCCNPRREIARPFSAQAVQIDTDGAARSREILLEIAGRSTRG